MQQDERLAEVSFFQKLSPAARSRGAHRGDRRLDCSLQSSTPDIWLSVTGVARILDPSSTLGIMAVAVALLMIGGEFDLSAGVMTGTTGLIAGMLATQLGLSIWLTMLVALVFALVVGYLNGLMVVKTGLPSFIVTLATFFILRGANVGVTRLVVNQVRVAGIDAAPGFDAARLLFNTEFSSPWCRIQDGDHLVDRAHHHRQLDPAPYQVWQLDLCHRWGRKCSPQPGCAGAERQDRVVHDHGCCRLVGGYYE